MHESNIQQQTIEHDQEKEDSTGLTTYKEEILKAT